MAKIKLVVSATIEETFKDFLISRKTKGQADKTLQSYERQFEPRHTGMTMDIAPKSRSTLQRHYQHFLQRCDVRGHGDCSLFPGSLVADLIPFPVNKSKKDVPPPGLQKQCDGGTLLNKLDLSICQNIHHQVV